MFCRTETPGAAQRPPTMIIRQGTQAKTNGEIPTLAQGDAITRFKRTVSITTEENNQFTYFRSGKTANLPECLCVDLIAIKN